MENFTPFTTIILIALLVNAVYAALAHKKGELNIYWDYTDATITGLSPFLGFIASLLLGYFGLPNDISVWGGGLFFSALTFYSVRMTWRTNPIWTRFISALIAKYTVLVVVYLIAFAVLGGRARHKYERQTSADAKYWALIALAAGLLVSWSGWVTRFKTFSPIGDWLAGKNTLPAQSALEADEG
jgi:hypothetical protein